MADRFYKMHGLGNDFVVIDAREKLVSMTPARARAIADRHNGIGCDQLILLESSNAADAVMHIYNADGSLAEACGNASRAVALLIGRKAELITAGGRITVEPSTNGATVEMGKPRFGWSEIPLAYAMDTCSMPVGWEDLSDPAAVNVGNPHLIFFVADCDAVALDRLGPLIENDPLFPDRINVNVATITGPHAIKLRVWERGAGLTLACGTGACATAVAAIKSKRAASPVEVTLPGGVLTISWTPAQQMTMTGPATHVFTGETDWSRFG